MRKALPAFVCSAGLTEMSDIPTKQKEKRGFAVMNPERVKEIAAMGGAAVPAHKRGFYKDPDFAARMGKIGGYWSPKTGKRK